ncbi:Uncharacterised protein [Brucella neotomae]|nr:Uncharacterised protein [Brucella neotomae]
MFKQALIVRDDDHGAIRRTQCVDTFRNDLQRIDIEAGVGFVENAKAWLQKLHLKNFSALLFTAREANVKRALQHIHIDVEAAGGVLHPLDEFGDLQFRLAARLALAVHRNLQEFHRGNARNFHRILERKEDALGSAFSRIEFEDRLAIIENVTFGDLIIITASENIGKRGLARTVRTHDRRHFTLVHGEVQAADDLGIRIGDLCMEVLDLKHKFKPCSNARKRLARKIGTVNTAFNRRCPQARCRSAFALRRRIPSAIPE